LDAAQAYERRWWTLGVLCMSLTIISLDNTILNVALPSIVRQLGAQGSQLQWIIDSYSIVFACLLLTAGTLGDKYGRKRALTGGLILFGSFSAVASAASSATLLIVARGLMGIGGAFIFPTTLSILTNTFSGRERAKAIGIWAGVSGLGVAIGPLAGGLLLEHFWWGSVFLVNVPVCVVAVALGRFFIPDTKDPTDRALDVPGAVLSVVALFGLMYGIIQVPDKGWANGPVLTGFVVGAVFLLAFALWELRSAHPMLDLRFFANPRFSAASATITLISFALYGSTFLLTQYFQFVLRYSPLKSGMMTSPVAIGLMIGAPQAPKLVERLGTTKVVVTGLIVVAAALACYASDTLMSSVVIGLGIRGLFGLGMGLTSAPVTESIMGSLPVNRAGVGSAVNDTTRQTGGALGVAVIGSVFAARYHASITGLSAFSPSVARAAHESIGTALTQVPKLPPAQGALLVKLADHAYISAMRPAFAMASAVVVLSIFVAAKFLPARAPVEETVAALAAAPAEGPDMAPVV
jgi:EmrB/QacA subfamily drug resistance transporter